MMGTGSDMPWALDDWDISVLWDISFALNSIIPVTSSQTCSQISALMCLSWVLDLPYLQQHRYRWCPKLACCKLVGLRTPWRTLIKCLSKNSCDSVLLGAGIVKQTSLYSKMVFLWSLVCLCMLSHVQLFATLWTAAHHAFQSMDFPNRNSGVGCHFLPQLWSLGCSLSTRKPVCLKYKANCCNLTIM